MKNRYIKTVKNNPNGIQLFCFHYAGGNASIYNRWKTKIDNTISLFAVQLAGRADLYSEDLIVDLDILLDRLYKEIKPYLDKPFVFFGHSMGGFIAYALTAYIEKVSQKRPEFIIISATQPPEYYYGKKDYLLSDRELKEKLKKSGATPDEILNSKELMDIILPIYRADYKLLETNKIAKEKIETKAFIFNSEEDIKKEIIMEWQEYFAQKIEYIKFNGGHFFIHKEEEDVITEINYILNSYF